MSGASPQLETALRQLDLAYGKLTPASFGEGIARPSGRATRVAPARGLTLLAVDYSDQPAGRSGADCLPRMPVL